MNVHVPRMLTAGEKALISAMEQARAALPGSPEVSQLRDAALARLRIDGLPSRKVEAWHYTDLRSLLRAMPAARKASKAKALVRGSVIASAGDDGVSALAQVEGVSVGSMAGAFASGEASAFMSAGVADAVGMVSSALASTGFDVTVAEGAAPGVSLQLDFAASDALHAINRVTVRKGAKAVIVERIHGGGLSSLVTHLEIADKADVTYVLLQETADDAVHMARLAATIGAGAKLLVILVNSGGGLVRRELDVLVAGRDSDFRLRGMNLLSGRRHVDVTMTVRHVVEHTSSTEFVRNVVTGEGKGVFQGQIRVAAEAQKTDARMACNTLLLSDEGEFLCKPELEIFADDVACGHGATVAEINRDHLFYLMARGVAESDARAMLVKAFVSELLDEVVDEALHDTLQDRLSAWLASH
jgi:Fe-S cluster assembly protein SufD